MRSQAAGVAEVSRTTAEGPNRAAARRGEAAVVQSGEAAVVQIGGKSKEVASGVYHFAGTKNYGTTKAGAYMCENDATAAGDRASKQEKHP